MTGSYCNCRAPSRMLPENGEACFVSLAGRPGSENPRAARSLARMRSSRASISVWMIGWTPSRWLVKSSVVTTRTVHSVRAVTVAVRPSPSISDSSPTICPSPSRASSVRPSAVSRQTATSPRSMMYAFALSSAVAISVSPGRKRCRDVAEKPIAALPPWSVIIEIDDGIGFYCSKRTERKEFSSQARQCKVA